MAQNIKPFRELDTSPDEQKLNEIATYYFDEGQYHTAIVSLEDLLLKEKDNITYKRMLADAYFNTYCYARALPLYQNLIEQNPNEFPLVYYKLGFVYKGLERYKEAEVTFKYFAGNFVAQFPDEAGEAKAEISRCQAAKGMLGTSKNTTVSPLPVNKYSKTLLSAISCNGDIVYTMVKSVKMPIKQMIGQDIIVETDSVRVSRLLINKGGALKELNLELEPNVNVGSPAFSGDCQRLYYTICRKVANKDRCEIYFSKLLGGAWTDPVKLNSAVNYGGRSSKNPAIIELANNKSVMLFSSDRPGGYGEFDIWMAETDEYGSFLPPKNLGNGINTNKNEVTPFFDVPSGNLFFSSGGHSGRGGLDVYMAKISWNSGMGKIYNLGKPVNSGMDDFHFYLKAGSTAGYLTSNRAGCADQIYETNFSIPFEYTRLPGYAMEVDQFDVKDTDLDFINEYFNYSKLEMKGSESTLLMERDAKISGTLLSGSEPGKHKVLLIDKDGEVIDVAITDRMGNFQFRKLPSDGKYAIILAEDDAAINLNVVVKDGSGKIVSSFDNALESIFNYRKLSAYNTEYLRLTESDASISGSLLNKNLPVEGRKVFLMDENQEVIDIALSDDKGNFTFKKLPSGGKYSILLDENDSHLDIAFFILDKEGKTVDQISSETESDVFRYSGLEEFDAKNFKLKTSDTRIVGSIFSGKQKAGEGHQILLVDKSGSVVSNTTTDKNGDFKFLELPKGGDYSFVLDKSDSHLKLDINIMDNRGSLSKHISSYTRKALFSYRDLDSDSKKETIDDASICGTLLAIENEMLKNYRVILMNNVGMSLDTALTNEYGDFRFDDIAYSAANLFILDNCLAHLKTEVEVIRPDQSTAFMLNNDTDADKFIYKKIRNSDNEINNPDNTTASVDLNSEPLALAQEDTNHFFDYWILYSLVGLVVVGGGFYYYTKGRS